MVLVDLVVGCCEPCPEAFAFFVEIGRQFLIDQDAGKEPSKSEGQMAPVVCALDENRDHSGQGNEIKSSIVENNRLIRTQMKQFNEYAKL